MSRKFQHTAARRRLRDLIADGDITARFNTQPRGGGCALTTVEGSPFYKVSTHSRAEAAALLEFDHS